MLTSLPELLIVSDVLPFLSYNPKDIVNLRRTNKALYRCIASPLRIRIMGKDQQLGGGPYFLLEDQEEEEEEHDDRTKVRTKKRSQQQRILTVEDPVYYRRRYQIFQCTNDGVRVVLGRHVKIQVSVLSRTTTAATRPNNNDNDDGAVPVGQASATATATATTTSTKEEHYNVGLCGDTKDHYDPFFQQQYWRWIDPKDPTNTNRVESFATTCQASVYLVVSGRNTLFEPDGTDVGYLCCPLLSSLDNNNTTNGATTTTGGVAAAGSGGTWSNSSWYVDNYVEFQEDGAESKQHQQPGATIERNSNQNRPKKTQPPLAARLVIQMDLPTMTAPMSSTHSRMEGSRSKSQSTSARAIGIRMTLFWIWQRLLLFVWLVARSASSGCRIAPEQKQRASSSRSEKDDDDRMEDEDEDDRKLPFLLPHQKEQSNAVAKHDEQDLYPTASSSSSSSIASHRVLQQQQQHYQLYQKLLLQRPPVRWEPSIHPTPILGHRGTFNLFDAETVYKYASWMDFQATSVWVAMKVWLRDHHCHFRSQHMPFTLIIPVLVQDDILHRHASKQFYSHPFSYKQGADNNGDTKNVIHTFLSYLYKHRSARYYAIIYYLALSADAQTRPIPANYAKAYFRASGLLPDALTLLEPADDELQIRVQDLELDTRIPNVLYDDDSSTDCTDETKDDDTKKKYEKVKKGTLWIATIHV